MSISSPLPTLTFSSRPLEVTFSLDRYPAPASDHDDTDSASDSEARDNAWDCLDPDSDDDNSDMRNGVSQQTDSSLEEDNSAVPDSKDNGHEALRQLDSTWFSSSTLTSESCGVGLPQWCNDTRTAVTQIATRLPLARPDTERRGSNDAETRRTTKTKRTPRVATGSQDGIVWIFRDPAFRRTPLPDRKSQHEREATVRASRNAGTTSPTPPASRPRSPPLRALSPPLVTRRSSASLSTLASFASTQSGPTPYRFSSGPPSLNGHSPYLEHRSRKASATVSVSTTTSTATPTLNHQGHHHTQHGPSQSLPNNIPGNLRSPPTSPTVSHPSTSSTSPTTNLPQLRLSPSTSSAVPQASSRRGAIPTTHGLKSKKESSQAPPLCATTMSRGTSSTSLHSYKQDSISSTSFGLWKGATRIDAAAPSAASSRSSLGGGTGHESADDVDHDLYGRGGSGDDDDAVTVHDRADEFHLEGLEPAFKILTPGSGPVVGLEVTHGRNLDEEEDVLVVLRQSGHLALLSLEDGRCFQSRRFVEEEGAESKFSTLRILDDRLAFCQTIIKTKPVVVVIDLDSLTIVQTIENVEQFDLSFEPTTLVYTVPDSTDLVQQTISPTLSVPITQNRTTLGKLGLMNQEERWKGLRVQHNLVVAWNETGLSVALIDHGRLIQIALIPRDNIASVDLRPDGGGFVVANREDIKQYLLVSDETHKEITLEHVFKVVGIEQLSLLADSQVLFARRDETGSRSLSVNQLSLPRGETKRLYLSQAPPKRSGSSNLRVRVTKSRKIDSDTVLLGFSNGAISLVSTGSIGRSRPSAAVKVELDGAISVLDVTTFGGREVVVAGSVNGVAGIWNLSDWEEIATFALFASPVLAYAHLPLPTHPHTLLFVSCNSPIALVSLHPPELLFTIPGSTTRVQLVATTKEGEVLILYEQGLARVWDARTGELRRSMDRKTAEGVLREKDKASTVWYNVANVDANTVTSSMIHPTIAFDLRSFLEDIARELPWSASKRAAKKVGSGVDSLDATPDISRAASPAPFHLYQPGSGSAATQSPGPGLDQLETVRTWLMNLVPFRIDERCDKTLGQLGIVEPPFQLALTCNTSGALVCSAPAMSAGAWRVSPHSTAHRLLLITCLLRVFLNYPATERVASEAIVYFASCLEDSVGLDFARPSFEVLAEFWLDKNTDVQQASKSLLGTYLASLSDDEILALVQTWERYLPSEQEAMSLDTSRDKADTAVLLIGLVAVDRFKLLSARVLKTLSAGIVAYLEDARHPFRQALATEMCSRGFHIWQHYIDAMALVRQLFSIAIGRNPSTPSDLRALARTATVHVAGVNSPLFMSTLLFDILNAPTAVSRNSTLKLLGFMIRKKPLVLYHSLPRVAEAVVKSLDPTVSDLRETVHQTATVILNELVRTFPSIDFHGKSQRLAIGTHEGSGIVWDLKTATRLYVLEGHRRPLTAVSWSPDGHRLVTVSLDESKVCVWKTGMGLLSMIGAPTRSAGSPPFKEWEFHVGDEALMTTAATLEWIIVDWPAERTVRLRLRETALSFGA
ncbi:WD40 repeat domain-containing protein [Sporobolomyces koalae]|uniref:WD40 repeat domain-containing protein n=1 Tax=Sporobolomyces koalae TaxID=500713 RepID=UPI00317C3AEA